MAQDREFKFVVGVETSTLPSATTPTVDDDLVTKGYADGQYAELASWQDSSADIATVKAIAAADRSDRMSVFIKSKAAYYYFDSGSAATGDDDLVLVPDVGTGRWLKIVPEATPAPVLFTVNGIVSDDFDTFDGWHRTTGNKSFVTLVISANEAGTGTTTVEIERWSGGPSGAATQTANLTGGPGIATTKTTIAMSMVDGDMIRAKFTARATNLQDVRIEVI